MKERPLLVAALLAGTGAGILIFLAESLPPSRYGPAALGALCSMATMVFLLRDYSGKSRWLVSLSCGVLGFLVGSIAGVGPFPWSTAFAAAWMPTLLLLIAGTGREQIFFELSKLEQQLDDPDRAPAVLARATSIRDEQRTAARELDPSAKAAPAHPGDARAVYAYAAHILAYADAAAGHFDTAVRTLDEVPVRWMLPEMRPLMLSNLAQWRLSSGDVDGARQAIATFDATNAPKELRPILDCTRASVLVQGGEIGRGIEIIQQREIAELPAELRARYRVVLAHAAVLEDNPEEAQKQLALARKELGDSDELARLAVFGGPAASMLRAMLSEPAAAPRDAAEPRAQNRQ